MIFHVMYFLDYGVGFGGAANTLLQQAVLMNKAGKKTTIVISNYLNKNLEEEYLNICIKNKIKLIELTYPICSNTEDIDIISVIQNYKRVKSKIIELNPDVLHSIQINPIVELISRELMIPHVMNIYPLLSDFFSIKYMDIFPHYHLCDSNYYAKKWNCYLGTESVCIRTVVNYVHQSQKKKKVEKEFLNYMCVGSVYERKNQFEVIKAFHGALKYGIKGKLFIFGYSEGKYADECRNYILKNELDSNIVLMGFCPDMEVEYQKNDVLICGSIMESYPNAVSEALANGLVVISTPVGGVPEIIIDHYNGYLCDGFTRDDIMKKIIELDNEKYTYIMDSIKCNAYKTFEKYHSSEVVTKQLIKYYNSLIQKRYVKENILINEVREKFSEIILLYKRNLPKFSDYKAVGQKLWYIYHIKEIIINQVFKEKKEIYIWGTGKYGKVVKEILEVFWKGINLCGYMDTYKKGFYDNYEIFSSLDILSDKKSLIMVGAVNGQEEMIKQLENKNKIFNLDYFILSPRVW